MRGNSLQQHAPSGGCAQSGKPAQPGAHQRYELYTRRWYLLAVFCLLSFQQTVIGMTFSPIAQHAEAYYNVRDPMRACTCTLWAICGCVQ